MGVALHATGMLATEGDSLSAAEGSTVLTLERCRDILGSDAPADERELQLVRDDLHRLSQLFIALLTQGDSRTRARNDSESPSLGASHHRRPAGAFRLLCSVLGDGKAYGLVERAAIMEYDGGLVRCDAEIAALEDWLSRTEH